jgi:hypothetical protein
MARARSAANRGAIPDQRLGSRGMEAATGMGDILSLFCTAAVMGE